MHLLIPRPDVDLPLPAVVLVPLAAVAERIGLAMSVESAAFLVLRPARCRIRLGRRILQLHALPAVIVIVLIKRHPAAAPVGVPHLIETLPVRHVDELI